MLSQQTEGDRETLAVAAELAELVSGLSGGSDQSRDSEQAPSQSNWVDVPVFGEVPLPNVPTLPFDQDLARELLELAPELAPGAQAVALRLGATILDQAAERVAAAERDDKRA
jgi:hypothetical protein